MALDVDRERLAAWTLARAEALSLVEAGRRVQERGSCREALAELGYRVQGSERRAAELSYRRAQEQGFTVLAVTEADYPLLLSKISDPPLVLTVWGELRREDALGLAVVGSRRATPYGLRMAHRLGRDLAASGLTIVSGLARGIDAAAHRGALEAGGRTLAVLGSGLLRLYPREHRRLAEAVAASGALVSEFDLDEPPLPRNFPRRNRLITGLTLGTLVVEATEKSGSLVSARHALEQDREVFAVPGPVTSPTSEGVHALLKDGACLVTAAEDVLAELRPETQEAIRARAAPAPEGKAAPSLDPDARQLLSRLARSDGALDVDSLVGATALPVGRVLAALTRLEVAGHVVRLHEGLYRSKI